MILEVAQLNVRPGQASSFELAFEEARSIISARDGFISLELQRCIEDDNKYILLVNWETLENHTVGFRESTEYLEWKRLLHHFYDPAPTVEHYASVDRRAHQS